MYVSELNTLLDEYHLLKHLFTLWTEGRIDRTMRDYAEQYYHHESFQDTSVQHTHYAKIQKSRKMLLENLLRRII